MWVTLIATAMAASVCLSVVNLVSQINKVRDAPHSPIAAFSAPRNAADHDQSQGTPTRSAQKNDDRKYFGPGT
jgi:hypothetical protein